VARLTTDLRTVGESNCDLLLMLFACEVNDQQVFGGMWGERKGEEGMMREGGRRSEQEDGDVSSNACAWRRRGECEGAYALLSRAQHNSTLDRSCSAPSKSITSPYEMAAFLMVTCNFYASSFSSTCLVSVLCSSAPSTCSSFCCPSFSPSGVSPEFPRPPTFLRNS
jgi:hypothetical protein